MEVNQLKRLKELAIASIAEVSLRDHVFLAHVALPAGLKTTCGKNLVYRTGMAASAEIITEDRRLIEKLFYQIRKVTTGRSWNGRT
ncbi:hypothetical protein GCM10028803_02680 [Larkinella knui]|uniref:hypothetical protein n=1 Tax=Larkinella knui TaxID=2025310 RepID=UPI00163976C3|nr:hypothetical protein [Larkinella knui]